jgi:spermidine/putrescine transport system ATP-binding protein
MASLVFEQITKSLGHQVVVDAVQLEIISGEIFSLLGPSGCGKTTLLRMAGGFLQPDRGRILLDGTDITALPPERRPVNTVFQNYALFPHLSVWENIAFGPRMAGGKTAEVKDRVAAMLDLIQLHDHAQKRPDALSGGQRQRVAIARALINRPRVLLLDEPLAALDLKLRQHMLTELRRIHREVGCTFVFVTHDQSEAIALSDRIGIMKGGRLQQVGNPAAIYNEPSNTFVASFIGHTNLLAASVLARQPATLRLWGQEVVLPGVSLRQAIGEPVRLSIRPESWWVKVTDERLPTAFTATVVDHVFLGAHTRVTARVHEDLVIIHLPRQWSADAAHLRTGETVQIGIQPGEVTVLSDEA